MTREQFEHAVRAAGAILGVDQVLVIGSQALHASVRSCGALLRDRIVDPAILRQRLARVPDLRDALRRAVEARIAEHR